MVRGLICGISILGIVLCPLKCGELDETPSAPVLAVFFRSRLWFPRAMALPREFPQLLRVPRGLSLPVHLQGELYLSTSIFRVCLCQPVLGYKRRPCGEQCRFPGLVGRAPASK